jgi:hypothetical protein
VGNHKPATVFQSTDAHSGSSACEIRTAHIVNKVPGIFIPDYAGSVFTGNQVGTQSTYGFPYSNKPALLSFWYKYNARGGDSATILITTTRWNTGTSSRDTIAVGYGFIKDSVGVYTKNETYLMTLDSINNPDTALVLISAAGIFTTHDGTSLLIDDITFEGGNVGVSELTNQLLFNVYPNPATKAGVNISLTESLEDIAVRVTDINGKLVYQQTLGEASSLMVPTESFISGFYFIHISSSKGYGVRKFIIE